MPFVVCGRPYCGSPTKSKGLLHSHTIRSTRSLRRLGVTAVDRYLCKRAIPPMKSSHKEIFRASTILGGTQVIVLIVRMLRSKVLAVMLGPGGTGLANLYTSTTDLVGVIAGLGIRSSGVRQIAQSYSTGDTVRFAKTVVVLRWAMRTTGVMGFLAVLMFCRPLSILSFGDDQHSFGMGLVAVVLILDGISAGQWTLLQGMRRIRDLAKCKIIGAVLGAIASVLLLGILREKGIVPLIIVSSASSIFVSWIYARRVNIPAVTMNRIEVLSYTKSFLGMGLAFLVSNLLSVASAYAARVFVGANLGIESVGLFTAALALSTIFVGFILEAMATDFYPRLSAVADVNSEVNRLVNEQTEMGLLLGMPAVLATIAFSSTIISLFYSSAFLFAVDLLRWQTLGIALRVVAWPMGFISMAKGRKDLFMVTETGYYVAYLGLLMPGVNRFGLAGAGIATFISYCLLILSYLFISDKLSGFRWSRESLRTLMIMGCGSGAVGASVFLAPYPWGTIVAAGVSTAIAWFSLYRLRLLLGIDVLSHIKARMGVNK